MAGGCSSVIIPIILLNFIHKHVERQKEEGRKGGREGKRERGKEGGQEETMLDHIRKPIHAKHH